MMVVGDGCRFELLHHPDPLQRQLVGVKLVHAYATGGLVAHGQNAGLW
ncbi:hypothetical protein MRBBS_0520 [Marinobacter sp. BSs20148]|nr:hypothetical protein MRBBS_0520 [Marinobacter sp. BSs20148]